MGLRSGGKALDRWLRDVPPPEWTKRPNAKDDLRAVAVEMRLAGKSYREIAEVVPVSKSTLSLWLRDVPLTAEQRRAVGRAGPSSARRLTLLATHARKREAAIECARSQVQLLAESELFVAGVAAYWAEGSKAKPWNPSVVVQFMNSDPGLIVLWLRWLDLVGVTRDRLTFRVSIHESADVRGAEQYWAELVGVDVCEMQKTTLKRHNPKTVRKNTGDSYRGCLTVGVRRSTSLYRQIAGWWQGIIAAPVA
jgi:hypothetical protein